MLLTLVEHDKGLLAPTSLEALAAARELADKLGETVEAVAFGPEAAHTAAEAGRRGASRLHTAGDAGEYCPEAWGETLRQLIAHLGPSGVVAAAGDRGNEVMAHAAARAGLPLAVNCLELSASGDEPWTLTRARVGGLLWEDADLDAEVKMVTVAAGSFAPREADADAPVETVAFAPSLAEG
ncbi:MAG: electron transfer flavoprotein subunit alpha/FixB family protein, partial [Stackebrandtia sp.]